MMEVEQVRLREGVGWAPTDLAKGDADAIQFQRSSRHMNQWLCLNEQLFAPNSVFHFDKELNVGGLPGLTTEHFHPVPDDVKAIQFFIGFSLGFIRRWRSRRVVIPSIVNFVIVNPSALSFGIVGFEPPGNAMIDTAKALCAVSWGGGVVSHGIRGSVL